MTGYHHDQHWSNRMILGDSLLVIDDEPGREGKAEGQGPDDLFRPAVRHQVRFELSGVDAQARREGRQGRGRDTSTGADSGWFIDTDYNGESFFVRHAYFTGGDEPYEKLRRALRAEIDEGAWSTLYSTVSRPFPPPITGKIALRVINHYGDEVLKVFEVM